MQKLYILILPIALGMIFVYQFSNFRNRTKVARSKLVVTAERNCLNIAESQDLGCERIPITESSEDGEAWNYYRQAFLKFKDIKYTKIEGESYSNLILEISNKQSFDLHKASLLLDGMQQPINLIHKAQKQRFFYYPRNHGEDFFFQYDFDLWEYLNLMNLLWIKIYYAESQEQQEMAIETALVAIIFAEDMFRLGNSWESICNRQIELIEWLEKILQNGRLDKRQLHFITEQLAQFEQYRIPMSLRVRWDRFRRIAYIAQPAIEEKYEDYIIVSNCGSSPRSKVANRFQDGLRFLHRYYYGYSQMPETAQILEITDSNLQELEKFADGPIATFLEELNRRHSNYIDIRFYREEDLLYIWTTAAKLHAVMTTAALKNYRLNKGRFPKSLQELTSILPESAFIDPFTSKPFRYSVSEDQLEVTFWSIGPDLKDDQGKPIVNYNKYEKQDGDLVTTIN